MDFQILVNYYEKISSTRKRLLILEYLTELFKRIKDNENYSKDLEKIIYLTQGALYPEIFEQPKLGLADKTILSFLSKYYTIDLKEANSILRKTGDMGLTAEMIAKKKKGKKSQLTGLLGIEEDTLSIADIYNKLEEISQIKGSGSLDKKYAKLKWLFARCTPSMLKYLIRIMNSTMRLGVSDPTIMDALSNAYLGSKDKREIIERAYNIHPDLGYIGRITMEGGIEGLGKVEISIGIPIRMMLASRLSYTQILPKLGGKEFLSEYKLDGERIQVHKNGAKIELFSRQLKNITDMYPDIIQCVKKNIKADKCIFEGEAVAMDPFYEEMLPFQVLITRKRKYDVKETMNKVNVRLYVFDLLFLEEDGQKIRVMDKPLLERIKKLEEIIIPSEQLVHVEGKMIHTTEELVEYFKYARSLNCEGLMNKSIDPKNSVYKAGNRGYLWIKLKTLEAGKMSDTIDAVVIGAKWGKGRRANRYGVLYMAVYNEEKDTFEMLTQCGSGFSDEDIKHFMTLFKPYVSEQRPENVICSEAPDVWFQPAIVMEIAGDELTVSPKSDAGKYYKGRVMDNGFSVRFPTFQRIRDDKGIYDVTTVSEIYEIYNNQG